MNIFEYGNIHDGLNCEEFKSYYMVCKEGEYCEGPGPVSYIYHITHIKDKKRRLFLTVLVVNLIVYYSFCC